MEVKEEMRLDCLCTVDGEGGAHCVSKCLVIGPLCHKMGRQNR